MCSPTPRAQRRGAVPTRARHGVVATLLLLQLASRVDAWSAPGRGRVGVGSHRRGGCGSRRRPVRLRLTSDYVEQLFQDFSETFEERLEELEYGSRAGTGHPSLPSRGRQQHSNAAKSHPLSSRGRQQHVRGRSTRHPGGVAATRRGRFGSRGALADVAIRRYAAPAFVAEAARNRTAARGELYDSCLDVGCGTGLAGPKLRPVVASLDGVDLSSKMAKIRADGSARRLSDPDAAAAAAPPPRTTIAQAALAEELVFEDGDTQKPPVRADAAVRKATKWPTVYDRVAVGDLLHLDDALPPRTYDLVVSADVLCYFGPLDEVLECLAERTAPGGDLIFSVETLLEGDTPRGRRRGMVPPRTGAGLTAATVARVSTRRRRR